MAKIVDDFGIDGKICALEALKERAEEYQIHAGEAVRLLERAKDSAEQANDCVGSFRAALDELNDHGLRNDALIRQAEEMMLKYNDSAREGLANLIRFYGPVG